MSYTPDKWTDEELEALEKRIAKVYKEAENDLTKEVNEYFAKFKIRDKEMKDLVDAGEMTNADYMKWRTTQIGRGKRYEALRDKVAERYTKANEVTNAYVNDLTPSIYSLNRNYEAYTIEKTVGNCDFTLWDESTVRRLLVEEPDLMPYYPAKRALNRGIDLAYGKDQITKRVTSGIIRGLSPGKIANELMVGITSMNRESAVRAARTGITAAENAGRLDSWRAAENMGITIRRRWVCTKDARTRFGHAMADGQTVEGTKTPFIVDGEKMMFPGDKSLGAHGWNIYNCRCTTRTVEKDGIEAEPRQMRVRDADGNWQVVNEMSYKDWEKWKKGIENSGNSGIIVAGKSVDVSFVDKTYGATHAGKVLGFLNGADDDVKSVWNKYQGKFKTSDPNYSGNRAFYSPASGSVTLNIGKVANGDSAHAPYQTLFHEYGHMTDYLAGVDKMSGGGFFAFTEMFDGVDANGNIITADRSKGGLLGRTAKQDLKNLINATKNKHGVTRKPEAAQLLISEINAKYSLLERTDVSDMLEGAGIGIAYPCGVGHGAKYWKGRDNGKEIFAEIISAEIAHPKSLECIKEYFPETYKVFRQMLEVIK